MVDDLSDRPNSSAWNGVWCVEFKLPAKHNSTKKLKARNVMAYSGSGRDWAALALVWHVTFYARRRKSNKFGGKYFRPCWLLLLLLCPLCLRVVTIE